MHVVTQQSSNHLHFPPLVGRCFREFMSPHVHSLAFLIARQTKKILEIFIDYYKLQSKYHQNNEALMLGIGAENSRS